MPARDEQPIHRDRWLLVLYAFLVLLMARKPQPWILYDGAVPGGRIDVTTVARRLWDHSAPAMDPDAHRPLASLLIWATAKLPGIDNLETSYTLWRFIWLLSAALVLNAWLRSWLTPGGAAAAVLLYLLGFAYAGFEDKPDGWLEQLLFAAGFRLLTTSSLAGLGLLVSVGSWGREAVVFLIPAYFLVAANRKNWGRILVECAWLLAAWCASWSLLHYLVGDTKYYSELWRLKRNFDGFLNYLRQPWAVNMAQYLVIGIFGPLWVLPYLPRPRGPELLERLKWLLPLALVLTAQLAKLWEVRVFYYHIMYLAPLALWKLFPDLRAAEGDSPGKGRL
jgi:hypothetical protein